MTSRRTRFVAAAAVAALAVGGCGGDAARTGVPTTPKPRPASSSVAADPGKAIRVKLPEWTYWEPIEALVAGNTVAPDLPLADAKIERLGGAAARWKNAPEPLRKAVLEKSFAVVSGQPNRTRLGAFYAALKDESVPFVVTLDTLFFLTHLALDRGIAEAESRQLAPALHQLLQKLEARLTSEAKDPRADLAPAYAIARGIVAVALQLASGAGYAPPPELAQVVAKERALVVAHAGPETSPLLGVTVDYSAFAPRGMADKDDAKLGLFRATTWLGQAPLMLAGSGEEGAAGKVDVALARTHARAALLVARLLDYDVDPEAAQAWERIDRLSQFIAGPADDVTPRELARVAVDAGADLKDARWIGNVAKVDRVRHLATSRHVTRLFDGAGGLRVQIASAPPGTHAADTTPARVQAPAPSVRLVGGRAAPDAEVLQGLVFPLVGAARPHDPAPATMRDGQRALPSSLDIAAWLGSAEARLALRETGDDGYEGYDAALDRLYQRRPPDNSVDRHASLYVSSLDAFATYVAPSAADRGQPGTATSAWRRRKMEVTLGAWTALRHDAFGFTRLAIAPSAAAPAAHAVESAVPAFVEPHPEAIAKLLALVRQTAKGLTALGALPADSAGGAVLAEIDQLLAVALAVALREANDEPLTEEQSAALAAFPGRVSALESQLAVAGVADVPVVADVHLDLGGVRVLEEATGAIEDLYMVIPEPRSRRLVLAVGASIPHYEFAEPASKRASDGAWRTRLQGGAAPARDAYVKGYVVGALHGAARPAPDGTALAKTR